MACSETLVEAALEVLNTADPAEKARLGDAIANRWLKGEISIPFRSAEDSPVPHRPARPSNLRRVAPNMTPKLGKGGSLLSRQAMLHSLVHTESWAIDLSWDIIARFGRKERMPKEFFTDFVKVAQDEGRHFMLLATRLAELGSFYGAFPVHDGLWDSAIQTSQDLSSRLVVEHCIHEARGLDVLPSTISRFRNGGDDGTAKLLETVVYPEEITHCAAGLKWFKYLCRKKMEMGGHLGTIHLNPQIVDGEGHSKRLPVDNNSDGTVVDLEQIHEEKMMIEAFHNTAKRYFRGPLKPPFNIEARTAAGFGREWYEPLVFKEF